MKKTLTITAVMALAGAASAQFTYPAAGPVTTADSIETINLGDAAPAGSYNIATITGDYLDDGSGSYSQEVFLGLDDGVTLNTFSGGFFGATDGTNTSAPGTFNWSIPLSGFAGGAGNDLFLNVANQFGGFNFTLSNISVTVDFVAPPSLAALAIGTLMDGDIVVGDTSGSSDDTQGGTGNPFGPGLNTGGDDIYELNWGGGRFVGRLDIFDGTQDLDLFLYDDASPASALAFGFTTGNPEVIDVDLPAGTYYLRVDGFSGDAGGYQLTVTPAPGAMALMGVAGLAGIRRRRA